MLCNQVLSFSLQEPPVDKLKQSQNCEPERILDLTTEQRLCDNRNN